MPDISMCGDENCPLKSECFRFRCIPSEFGQSYFGESPYDEEEKTCDFFAGILGGDRLMEIKK